MNGPFALTDADRALLTRAIAVAERSAEACAGGTSTAQMFAAQQASSVCAQLERLTASLTELLGTHAAVYERARQDVTAELRARAAAAAAPRLRLVARG
jgi:hypothetical protein